jgi:phenylalanyl-tRNA synthetase beta chain
MICAQDELGLGQDHSGIIVLDPSAVPGTPFRELAGPPEDILEVEVTPNRPDCLGLIGVAREISALNQVPYTRPPIDYTEDNRDASSLTSVEVEDSSGCYRYIARLIEGVEIKPSPDWMQSRLAHAGIRPINNVVDITNYVLLECGQPLHAFDQSLLDEGRIVVRRARDGEKMVTLDDVERELDSSMLVIADASKPVAVAGVMGGAGSEIHEGTTSILLEAAAFDATTIRQTARKLGLSSESSYRFERGVDPNLPEWASRRAVQLILELAGGTAVGGKVEVCREDMTFPQIRCRFDKVARTIGVEISPDDIMAIFNGLELTVVEQDAEACLVQVPSFRVDLSREADLVEEVARVYGLDRIPAPSPKARLVQGADDQATRSLIRLRAMLNGLGLSEVMHYSFLSDKLVDLFGQDNLDQRVRLPHPISADHTLLRPSLLPQLSETLGRNRSRQIEKAAFFEIGRTFLLGEGNDVCEQDRLAVGLMGKIGQHGYGQSAEVSDEQMYLWIKGIFEALARACKLDNVSVRACDHAAYESGRAVELLAGGDVIGHLGLLKESIRSKWRLSDPVGLMELSVARLISLMNGVPSYKEVPVYPSVQRDFAILVSEEVSHADVTAVLKKLAPAELTRVELFDIFRSDKLKAGHKSMAYALTYQSSKETLTDEKANELHNALKAGLVKALDADLRDG